jgi:autoinducer 2-degrading protein
MYVVAVTVRVIPEYVEAFVAATRANAEGTRKEPANLRFDVLRVEDGFKAHQQTAHYLAWKQAVAPWMAVPRVAAKCVSILPDPWR